MRIPLDVANTIVDPKAYADPARIDAAFTFIRNEMPFAVAEPDGFEPFWVVSRHADLLDVERRADVFHNGAGCSNLTNKEAHAFVKFITGGEPNLIRSLVSIDGEEHKALRGITFPSLTPKNVRVLEDSVRSIARSFADHMLSMAPECDFAQDVAFLYPLRVIMSVLGVPQEDEPLMLKLTQELFGSSDPDLNRSGAEVDVMQAVQGLRDTMLDLEAYFAKVTEKFRAEPDSCLNSLIANAKVNGEYLNHRQLMGYYIIAATAGHDTTSNATAAAMWALAERPGLLDRLKTNPELLPAFIEESIRWSTPVKTFMRTAVADAEVAGQQVKAGDWLLLSYHSANRDEAVFDRPFDFDFERPNNKQVAFGSGPHVCLGQHLARLEMRVLWEELLPRLASVELAGEPKITQSNFVVGPKSVPIRFTLAN